MKTCSRKGRKCQTERKGMNRKNEKEQREHQDQRQKRRCSMVPKQVFPAAHGGPTSEQMAIPEGTAAHGGPMPEKRKSEREGVAERSCYVLTLAPPSSPALLEFGSREPAVKK